MNWFNTIIEDGRIKVFDPIRKIYCTLTPEEEVRQKMLYYLVEQKNILPDLSQWNILLR